MCLLVAMVTAASKYFEKCLAPKCPSADYAPSLVGESLLLGALAANFAGREFGWRHLAARLSHHAETGAWVGKCIERLSESVVAHPWRRAVGEMWLLVVFHMARAAKVAKRIASRRVRGQRCNAILCAGPSWRQGRSIAWHPVWIRSSFDSGLNRDDAAFTSGVDVVTRNAEPYP